MPLEHTVFMADYNRLAVLAVNVPTELCPYHNRPDLLKEFFQRDPTFLTDVALRTFEDSHRELCRLKTFPWAFVDTLDVLRHIMAFRILKCRPIYRDVLEKLRAFTNPQHPEHITANTAAGPFSAMDHGQLAFLVWRRMGMNNDAATHAWRKMLGNDCPVSDFMELVAWYYRTTITT